MDTPDPTHQIEVRMYSRDIAGFCELFYRDHEGNERVVCQWKLAERPARREEPQAPPINSSPAWALGDLLKAAGPMPVPRNAEEQVAEAVADLSPPPGTAQFPSPPMFGPPIEVPLDDTARRRAAKARIRTAVAALSRNTHDQQMRYELALQAKNRNTRALELFEMEAKAAGVSVSALVDRVIVDRHARERRMMHVYAIQAESLATLDKAGGEEIGRLEAEAVTKIETE